MLLSSYSVLFRRLVVVNNGSFLRLPLDSMRAAMLTVSPKRQ